MSANSNSATETCGLLTRPQALKLLTKRIVVLLLLLAVPALATMAKTSWYLPQSNLGHYLTIASKMKVACSPVVFDRGPVARIARVVPPQPLTQETQRSEWKPAIPWISLTLSPAPAASLRNRLDQSVDLNRSQSFRSRTDLCPWIVAEFSGKKAEFP